MSVMTRLRATAVVAPDGVLRPGWVDLDGARIVALGEGEPPPDPAAGQVLDLGDVVLVPGFVDLHCHGGGGASFGADPDAARTAAALHLAHGTTTLMASLVAGPPTGCGARSRPSPRWSRTGCWSGSTSRVRGCRRRTAARTTRRI